LKTSAYVLAVVGGNGEAGPNLKTPKRILSMASSLKTLNHFSNEQERKHVLLIVKWMESIASNPRALNHPPRNVELLPFAPGQGS